MTIDGEYGKRNLLLEKENEGEEKKERRINENEGGGGKRGFREVSVTHR